MEASRALAFFRYLNTIVDKGMQVVNHCSNNCGCQLLVVDLYNDVKWLLLL